MLHELSFRPPDPLAQQEFEGIVHDFVALEANKPADEASAVFARYDAAAGTWSVSFESDAALEAFRDYWRARSDSGPARRDDLTAAPESLAQQR